jgi:hypothetical protein
MSTRGFVGIGTPDHWDARYNHWDSYPTALGADVWHTAQQFLQQDGHLQGFAQRLLGFTDWRQMGTDGICEYCGQHTGHPHSINGRIAFLDQNALPTSRHEIIRQMLVQAKEFLWDAARQASILVDATEEWAIVENLQTTGYPDPQVLYHQHDDPASAAITPNTIDWIFMEWGYIIDPSLLMLHVYKGCVATPISYEKLFIRPSGETDLYTSHRTTGVLTHTLSLTEPEPDWDTLEHEAEAHAEVMETLWTNHPDDESLRPLHALPPFQIIDQRAG